MKSGFAIIVGRSNVGKSTLLNTLVGTKLAATTVLPQTTRDVIHGVVNDLRGQIVFVDTPGILKGKRHAPSHDLEMKVRDALSGIDVIIYLVDPTRSIGTEERFMLSLVRGLPVPKILVLNKIDIPKAPYREDYLAFSPEVFDHIIEISALERTHVKTLVSTVLDLLPEGEPFYTELQRTNLTREQWVAEIIREKVLHVTRDEVPYSAAVFVDSITEETKKKTGTKYFAIHARITVPERYKKMLVGAGGRTVKTIGTNARVELEAILDSAVFLDLEIE